MSKEKGHMTGSGNTLAVRRYYGRNRSSIIKAKTLFACKHQDRVPRAATIQMYSMSIDDLLNAFQDWQEHLTPTDPLRIKQTNKMNSVLAQCVRV